MKLLSVGPLLVLLSCINDCRPGPQPAAQAPGKPLVYLTPDTSHYAIIPLDSADLAVYHFAGRLGISSADIARAEAVLRQQVAEYNRGQDRHHFLAYDTGFGKAIGKRDKRHIELTNYFRQYQGAVSPAGHRIVIIHGFCPPAIDGWRKEVVLVNDGGNCFFFLKADLTDPESPAVFSVNGEA